MICPPLTPTLSSIFTAPLVVCHPLRSTPTTSPIFTAPLVVCPPTRYIPYIYSAFSGLPATYTHNIPYIYSAFSPLPRPCYTRTVMQDCLTYRLDEGKPRHRGCVVEKDVDGSSWCFGRRRSGSICSNTCDSCPCVMVHRLGEAVYVVLSLMHGH